MMPFSTSDPASSDSSPTLNSHSLERTPPIGSQPPCPDTTSGIWTILGVHKTDIKQTRPGCHVVFHFVTTPSSQTRAQVNFLSWTPFWRPFCPFFLPYDRPSKGSGLSELLVAQDTVKMQGIFFLQLITKGSSATWKQKAATLRLALLTKWKICEQLTGQKITK